MIALLPAAGLSRRMGTQKLLLPFGAGTVLEAVIGNLCAVGLTPIFCVFSKATLQGLRDVFVILKAKENTNSD